MIRLDEQNVIVMKRRVDRRHGLPPTLTEDLEHEDFGLLLDRAQKLAQWSVRET